MASLKVLFFIALMGTAITAAPTNPDDSVPEAEALVAQGHVDKPVRPLAQEQRAASSVEQKAVPKASPAQEQREASSVEQKAVPKASPAQAQEQIPKAQASVVPKGTREGQKASAVKEASEASAVQEEMLQSEAARRRGDSRRRSGMGIVGSILGRSIVGSGLGDGRRRYSGFSDGRRRYGYGGGFGYGVRRNYDSRRYDRHDPRDDGRYDSRDGFRSAPIYEDDRSHFACFPANAMVQTPGGQRKITELSVGDMVLTHGDIFSKVLFFAIRQPTADAHFLSVKTANSTVTLTPSHAVFLEDGTPTLAGDLQEGQHLLSAGEIQSITNSTGKGLVAPITGTGKLVVDGVTTSDYGPMATQLGQQLAHNMIAPLRVLHWAFPQAQIWHAHKHMGVHPFKVWGSWLIQL